MLWCTHLPDRVSRVEWPYYWEVKNLVCLPREHLLEFLKWEVNSQQTAKMEPPAELGTSALSEVKNKCKVRKVDLGSCLLGEKSVEMDSTAKERNQGGILLSGVLLSSLSYSNVFWPCIFIRNKIYVLVFSYVFYSVQYFKSFLIHKSFSRMER